MKARTRLLLNSLALTVIGGAGRYLQAMPNATSASSALGYCCVSYTCQCCGFWIARCDSSGCYCN